ncbi:MAG: hypothetical protein Q7S33_04595 [Nanoarchaeota archaeon]|nr:hypothetical protein [Nanoarchaeota archaeon]
MALNFSKINDQVVGYKVITNKLELKLEEESFAEFIISSGMKEYTNLFEEYNLTCNYSLDRYQGILKSELEESDNIIDSIVIINEMQKAKKAVELIRENYGLEILAETGILPKHFLNDIK